MIGSEIDEDDINSIEEKIERESEIKSEISMKKKEEEEPDEDYDNLYVSDMGTLITVIPPHH